MSDPSVAIRVTFTDAPEALARIVAAIAAAGGSLRTLATPRVHDGVAEAELEVAGIGEEALASALADVPDVLEREATRALDRVFGKRIIVVGGCWRSPGGIARRNGSPGTSA